MSEDMDSEDYAVEADRNRLFHKMYAKEHKELLEDIVGYIKNMNLHELRTLADVMASEGWVIYEK